MMDNTNQRLRLSNNRYLGYAEYGEQSGIPVFHFHGSSSSRLERPADSGILENLDIHFISVDRPGHGTSDFQPDRKLIDWAKDIEQLADHLKVGKFYVTGHSAGGPHALACAHQLPHRVLAGAVISSVAPMSRRDAYQGMPLLNQVLARAARNIPGITRHIRRIMRKMVMGDVEKATKRLMSSIPEADKAALEDAANQVIFFTSIREGFRQGYQAIAHDDILVNGDWGFDLAQIEPRIDIWHGDADVNVPIHAGKYLSAFIPHNRAFFLPNLGHFFVLQRWREVLAKLVEKG